MKHETKTQGNEVTNFIKQSPLRS